MNKSKSLTFVIAAFLIITRFSFGATLLKKGVYSEQKSPISGVYVFDTQYRAGKLFRISFVNCLFSYYEIVNGEMVFDKNVCSTVKNPNVITLNCDGDFCSNDEKFFVNMTIVDMNTLHKTYSNNPSVSIFLNFQEGKIFKYDN